MMARPHNMWESVMLTLLNHANLTVKEIKFGGKEAFTGWRGHAAPFKAEFLGEFKAYPYHQYSFILPVDEKTGVFKWWEGLLGCISAMILPVQCFFFFFFFLIFSYHGKLMGICCDYDSILQLRYISFTWTPCQKSTQCTQFQHLHG